MGGHRRRSGPGRWDQTGNAFNEAALRKALEGMEGDTEFKPDWTVPAVPCEGAGCTPLTPSCGPCLAGKRAFEAELPEGPAWHELSEFARGSWRIEAADV